MQENERKDVRGEGRKDGRKDGRKKSVPARDARRIGKREKWKK